MEKVETPLDVLSRAATMVQPCPAYPVSDSDSFGKDYSLIILSLLAQPKEIYEIVFYCCVTHI